MSNLLQQFIEEGRDLLHAASNDLLILEQDPTNADAVNELFRSIHTFKGSSALFELPSLTKLVHVGEDVLDEVRSGAVAISSLLIDLQLELIDILDGWLNELEERGDLPEDAAQLSSSLAAKLAACRSQGGEQSQDTTKVTGALTHDEPFEWLRELDEDLRLLISREAIAASVDIYAIEYLPDEKCFFQGDDPLQTCRNVMLLQSLQIETAPRDLSELFDPYICTMRVRMLSLASRAELDEIFRYVPEQVDIRHIDTEVLVAPDRQDQGVAEVNNLVKKLVQDQVVLLELELPRAVVISYIAAAAHTLSNIALAIGHTETVERIAALLAAPEEEWDADAFVALATAWLHPPVAQRAANKPRVARSEESTKEALSHRTLKVEQSQVDRLMLLIGELVVAKNSLSFLARRAESTYGSRELSREIGERYSVIDRLAQEMQEAIMEVRLLPVSQVFQRFPRLVRDISHKLKKEIELELVGEDTRIDKNVIELLADPLIHILRNAADHGIEMPAVRIERGKPAQGIIRISADQSGDQVIIKVHDDGGGIDHSTVLTKAIEHGIIDQQQAERMSPDDISKLIFHPGLSTAPEITDLSGRGVGMDVVLTSVQSIGGDVTVHTEPGIGTTVRLTLPLSIAVMRVMTVETENTPYAIPIGMIVETVRIETAKMHKIKNAEAFLLRDLVVPLIRLRALLELPAMPQVEEAVLVLRSGDGLVGLIVDRFDEHMDIVLKPLEGVLAGIRAYSGTALLGDGRVLLVLEMKELLTK